MSTYDALTKRCSACKEPATCSEFDRCVLERDPAPDARTTTGLPGQVIALDSSGNPTWQGEAPEGPDETVTHHTPEEHDQPECDADVDADPGTVMFGTLNPRKVTCPDCLAAMDPEPAPEEG